MSAGGVIAEHILHAAEPHLEDLPLERVERYEEGLIYLERVRGRTDRDAYFVYRVSIRCLDPPWTVTAWFLIPRNGEPVECFDTDHAAVAKWAQKSGQPDRERGSK